MDHDPGPPGEPRKGPVEPEPNGGRRRWWGSPWLWFLGLLLAVNVGLAYFMGGDRPADTIAYSEFVQQVKAANVADATFNGSEVTGKFAKAVSGKGAYTVEIPAAGDPELMPLLLDNGVKVTVTPSGVDWGSMLLNYLPGLLLILGFGWLLLRGRGGPGIGGISQSKARLYSAERPSVTFADVASNQEAKQELEEIIEFLKNPKRFTELGARIPHGVLLVGPPGTGKTLMARAVAGEANVPFFSVSATEFVEMFVGVGAARIRDLFTKAKAVAPCIVFVDEIDSIGRERGSRNAIASNEEREQTLNQLLVEMDGFEPNQGIIVLSATNRPDILDVALLRPGRFDRRVELALPDRPGRLSILKLHAAKVRMGRDCDLDSIARRTPGFSGADLANLINEAALLAARARRPKVAREDLEGAFEKVLLGARQQFAMTEEERNRVAVHESGHAVAAFFTKGADPPEKVSVVPHGRSLGVTQFAPAEDRRNLPESYVRARLVVALAGREAEEIVLGEVSSGAENDLAGATAYARSMVMRWGMGSGLGPVTIGEQSVFGEGGMVSPELLSRADEEVVRLLQEAEAEASRLLREQRHRLDALIAALHQSETLDREAIEKVLEVTAGPGPSPIAAA